MIDYSNPKNLTEYIVSPDLRPSVTMLKEDIALFKAEGRLLKHIMFTGASGCGKTALARAIAGETGIPLIETLGYDIDDIKTLVHKISLAAKQHGILFIDEIHSLRSRAVTTALLRILTGEPIEIASGRGANTCKRQFLIPPITIFAATTDTGKVPSPLRNRFPIRINVYPLANEVLGKITKQYMEKHGAVIEPGGTAPIATRSFGIARIALQMADRVMVATYKNRPTVITAKMIDRILTERGVTAEGLTYHHLKYLIYLATVQSAGIDNIVTCINADKQDVLDTVEPALVQLRLIQRSARGREITREGLFKLESLCSFFGVKMPTNATAAMSSLEEELMNLCQEAKT